MFIIVDSLLLVIYYRCGMCTMLISPGGIFSVRDIYRHVYQTIIVTIRVTRYTKRVFLLPELGRHLSSKILLCLWRLLWHSTLLFSCLWVLVWGIAWYLIWCLTSPVLPFVKPTINSPGHIGTGVCVFSLGKSLSCGRLWKVSRGFLESTMRTSLPHTLVWKPLLGVGGITYF